MRYVSIVTFTIFFVTIGYALERARPEAIGLSEAKLELLTEYLEKEVADGRIAGAVGLIARHGRIGYLEAMGFQDLESSTKMEEDSLFRIASMTKAITAAAIMSLVEEGKLKLEDPLSKYLPEFGEPKVLSDLEGENLVTERASEPITIHQLMAHISGVPYGWFGPEKLDAQYHEADIPDLFIPVDETMRERVARLAKLPLKHQPGTAWEYGLSSDILGVVVEEVSGLNLEQFFHERFLRPLVMGDTHFHLPSEKRSRLAGLYSIDENEKLVRVGSEPVTSAFLTFSDDYNYAGSGNFFSGGGGLASSTIDYARFLQMLLSGGTLDGRRVLAPDSVERMTRNQIGERPIGFEGHGDGFGYGFGVLTQAGKGKDIASVGTYSWGGIFNTYYWVDPQEEMVGILMTQIFPFFHLTIRDDFKRMAYDAIDDSGFARRYWYEKGVENGNPYFNGRQLRVNAPEVSVHERFAVRSEPQSSGMARILVEEDLRQIRRADLYCEIWGGHPGTANKRVTVNGRSVFEIPRVGCEEKHCTHLYPEFNLKATDLVNGYNSLQFACDSGTTFWGHYIVDNACLKVGLKRSDAFLVEAGLESFQVEVVAKEDPNGEVIELKLDGSAGELSRIKKVVYQARYFGYDENGNRLRSDWHGMTKGREPYGMLGDSVKPPFELTWDTSLVPAQFDVQLRALVEFKDLGDTDLVYQTASSKGIAIGKPEDVQVALYESKDLPEPFWSRAERLKQCSIELDCAPSKIEKVELHVVSWTGGAGTVEDYFTLNGTFFPVAEGHAHELVYSRIEIDPKILRKGKNEIKLVSDTEHHGIEIMLPGPALLVRKKL